MNIFQLSNTRVLEYAYIPRPLHWVRVLFNMKRIHTVFIGGWGKRIVWGFRGQTPLKISTYFSKLYFCQLLDE